MTLPSLNALRAFHVLSRTGSFSAAGPELNVTRAAVSQQVKSLEDWLGIRLITRTSQGIELTEEGNALAQALETGFEAIRQGVEELTGEEEGRPVRVTTSPAFAQEWLMPRLHMFREQHPGIGIAIDPTSATVELGPKGADLAIRFCQGTWPGMQVTPFLKVDLVTVGKPELLAGIDRQDYRALLAVPWLQELGTREIVEWFLRHGVEPDERLQLAEMPGNLILAALRRGEGLTYTPRPFVQAEIDRGELVEITSEADVGDFYIVNRPGVMRRPVRAFVRWLRTEQTDC